MSSVHSISYISHLADARARDLNRVIESNNSPSGILTKAGQGIYHICLKSRPGIYITNLDKRRHTEDGQPSQEVHVVHAAHMATACLRGSLPCHTLLPLPASMHVNCSCEERCVAQCGPYAHLCPCAKQGLGAAVTVQHAQQIVRNSGAACT